jgi:hypothetical protein
LSSVICPLKSTFYRRFAAKVKKQNFALPHW